MLDFEIREEKLPVIKINFKEMKQALQQTIDKYKGIVVTQEQLSLCKSDQKELASMRKKIDDYRKSKKKELSKPISAFEIQCKELVSMVEDAEIPIKEGIKTFDDKRREEKRQKAIDTIKSAIEEHGLNEKYARQLTVLDKYMNLSGSFKSVQQDIEQRCFILLEKQKKEEELLQAIEQTIENANKDIKTPIKIQDVQYLIRSGASLPDIISRINQLKEKIKLAEMPNPDSKPEIKVEPIQDAERQITKEDIPQEPIKSNTPSQGNLAKEPTIYFVEFHIEGTRFDTAKIGQFLRENDIKYNVLNKGQVAN